MDTGYPPSCNGSSQYLISAEIMNYYAMHRSPNIKVLKQRICLAIRGDSAINYRHREYPAKATVHPVHRMTTEKYTHENISISGIDSVYILC